MGIAKFPGGAVMDSLLWRGYLRTGLMQYLADRGPRHEQLS